MKKTIILLTLVMCFTFYVAQAAPITRYVKPAATGIGDGTSWVNASGNLQAMINASISNDQIWVAAGTYKPTTLPGGCTGCGVVGSTNRNNTFLLKSGILMYGGFAGNETVISQRNFNLNETILSGDIGTIGVSSDNVYHVVTAISCTNFTILDKFTIQEGNANGAGSITVSTKTYFQVWGGGMLNVASALKISNCSFVTNLADSGGGMLNTDSSNPTITNSVFANNTANGGGGIYNHDFSSPTFNSCTIAYNAGTVAGGAMYNYNGSQPTINNSIMWANTGGTFAGVANNGGSLTVNLSIIQNGASPCNSCLNTNGNIDPLFINTTDLNGPDNRWGNADDGLQLSNCSPAIDGITSGTYLELLTLDITGQPRQFDVPFRQNAGLFFYDLGAYESQSTVPTKVYVNNTLASGANNGTSWANAFNSPTTALQDALNTNTCEGNEIWVAAGTYKPSSYPTGCTGCASNRDFTFLMKDGIKMYGGFLGNETAISQRNILIGETILSGDIGVINDVSDNTYHVMLAVNDVLTNQIDGFIIQKGGVYANLSTSSITVEGNNILRHNAGGLYCIASKVNIANCTFRNNDSNNGGGIYDSQNFNTLNPIIEKCIFISNRALNAGGGIYNDGFYDVKNCVFTLNSSLIGGGIISWRFINITNSSFISNVANSSGGGLFTGDAFVSYTSSITNCTFASNQASIGGGGIWSYFSSPIITNTIIWGNTTTIGVAGFDNYTSPVVSNSIIQDGFSPCTSCPNTNGNIDPQLLDIAHPAGPDNIHRTFDDGIALRRTSPAVNAGTNTGAPSFDILGSPIVVIRDIGAYEVVPKDLCISYRHIGDVPIENGTHAASFKITANGSIGSGSTTFNAGASITLLPGFTTLTNAVFRTQLLGCGGG